MRKVIFLPLLDPVDPFGMVWYGMVWYALRYREWLAGRSLTLPVFRAGVRGQLAVTLGCRTPGFGGGGVVAALSPSSYPSPRARASCAAVIPVVPVLCVPVLTKPKDTRTGRAYWSTSASRVQ